MNDEETAENGAAKNDTSISSVEESALNVSALKADLEKARNDNLYLRADFDNYKKSVLRERTETFKYGSQQIFVELLEILDNFERALNYEVTPENYENVLRGINLIRDEMKSLLSRFNVAELPALGEKFDPNLHNALGSEPTDKVPSGHISQVLKKPYKLHDRVIRPAQVVVASEPQKQS